MEGTLIRDYISGGTMAAATFVSILVNPCLIYYYKRFQTSWIHRYYYYLAIAHLCYAICKGVPFTCQLLNHDYPPENVQWFNELLSILTKVSSASVTTVVCVAVTVQHLNICHPGWTVINGASRSGKYAFFTILSFYLALSVPALIALILIFLCHFTDLPFEDPTNLYVAVTNLIFFIPTIIFTLVSGCLYLITRVKFLALDPDEDQIEVTRKEFMSVGVFVLFALVHMALTITYFVLIFDEKITNHSTVIIFGINMELIAQRAIIACSIFFNENAVRDYILCRPRGGAVYEALN